MSTTTVKTCGGFAPIQGYAPWVRVTLLLRGQYIDLRRGSQLPIAG